MPRQCVHMYMSDRRMGWTVEWLTIPCVRCVLDVKALS